MAFRFQFRFQTLLELRQRERDQAGAAVGQALEAIRKIEQQQLDVETEREQTRSSTSAQLAGSLSVDRLLVHGRYELQLTAQLDSLRQTREKLATELANRRQRLVEAEAEVKRFERLEQQEREEFEKEFRRREQFENDDAAGRRYAIALRPGPLTEEDEQP